MDRKEFGLRGEWAAQRYLRAMGYEILEKNWRCRYGEADIIAMSPDGCLCFIEVKTRHKDAPVRPEDAVTRYKRSRYERIALSYLAELPDPIDEGPLRFDTIGILVAPNGHAILDHSLASFCFDED